MYATGDPSLHVKARSSSGAWSSIVNKAYAIRNKPPTNAVCGPDLFGFTCPEVAKMIQEMDGAKSCTKYKWQTFLPAGKSA